MSDLSREEWAAKAEHSVRTACYPLQRVPEEMDHYLTADEIAEHERLFVELSKATRPVLTRGINALRKQLPEAPEGVTEYVAWYYALPEDQQHAYERMKRLQLVRTDLTRRAKGQTATRVGWDMVPLKHNVFDVPELVPDADGLARLKALIDKYSRLRSEAATKATDDAVAAEVARRQTDAAWAKELERRASPIGILTYGDEAR